MPSGGEELHKVMELPVDVAAHRDRAVDWLHVGLLDEYLLNVFAEGLELVLGEVLALLDLGDPQIQIHGWLGGRRTGGGGFRAEARTGGEGRSPLDSWCGDIVFRPLDRGWGGERGGGK